MIRRMIFVLFCAAALSVTFGANDAKAQQAYGRQWGNTYSTQDWNRLYHYPYVYYPQNFWGNDYYRSSESMYYRYPPEMRIPVYNKQWQNFYPQHREDPANQAFTLAKKRYYNFEGTLVDVREAVRNLERIQSEVIDVKIDLLLAKGSKALLNGGYPS